MNRSDSKGGEVAALRVGGKAAAIIPTSIEEIFRLAQAIHKSGLAPQGMDAPEKLTVAILHGMEIGLPPMQAVQRIAIVNGRPTVWGDAIPALLLSRGFKLREWIEGDGDSRTAWCEITRPDGDVTTRSFSVHDAKRARLWGKPGPWQNYPDRMLQMRARGFCSRDGASDVLAGLYLAEELQDDANMRDVTPRSPRPSVVAPAVPDIEDIVDDIPPDDVDQDAQDYDTILDEDFSESSVIEEFGQRLNKDPLEHEQVTREFQSVRQMISEDGRRHVEGLLRTARTLAGKQRSR